MAITGIPITGITATVVPRFLDLVTVTGIMAAIGAVILLMACIMAMAVFEEGTETAGTVGLAVLAAISMAAFIDKKDFLYEVVAISKEDKLFCPKITDRQLGGRKTVARLALFCNHGKEIRFTRHITAMIIKKTAFVGYTSRTIFNEFRLIKPHKGTRCVPYMADIWEICDTNKQRMVKITDHYPVNELKAKNEH